MIEQSSVFEGGSATTVVVAHANRSPTYLPIHRLFPFQVVINHGVELCDGAAKQIALAVELCARNFRKVLRSYS